jgi:4-amino-4-deoxy-L-arabinose transferase-like glycosyltransferase
MTAPIADRSVWRRATIRDSLWADAAALVPCLLVFVAATLVVPLARETGDEANYLAYAQRLAHGGYANLASPWPVDYLWHGPGLPLLLAPLRAIDAPVGLMRLLGPLLLWGALIVFCRLTSKAAGRRVALWASFALLLYLPFYTVLGPLHVEPLATLLFTAGVLFSVRAAGGVHGAERWAGVMFGLLALSRLEYGVALLLAACVALVWLLARRRSPGARRLAAASCIGLLCCVPWLAYTYSLTGNPLYWGNSGGLSLYWMSAPTEGNLGDWHPPYISARDSFLRSNAPAVRANQATLAGVAKLAPLEQDARLQERAFANIRERPDVYLSNLVNNGSRLLFNFPYSHSAQSDRPLIYALPNAVLLGALVVAGVVQLRDRRRPRPGVLVVGALVLLGFAIHLPVAGYGRFTVPLVPAAAYLVIVVLHPRLGPGVARRSGE